MFSEPAAPEQLLPAAPPVTENPSKLIAPLWHTLLLIIAIAAYSFWGAQRFHPASLDPLAPVHRGPTAPHADNGADATRIVRYALSAGLELLIVAWVWLGLRLRRTPFRSLLGNLPRGLNAITLEAGIAALFWFSSMTVLFVLALTWQLAATQVYQHQVAKQSQSQSGAPSTGKPESPEKKQAETIRELLDLAPANGIEIAAWGALCLIVGFSEEFVFRGYLQSQGIALFHRIPLGVLLSAIVFGFAHGYQGLRGMCLIGAFGAMFSIIALMRRSLFPGMLAHAWHDFLMGLLLMLIRSMHIIDKLLAAS